MDSRLAVDRRKVGEMHWEIYPEWLAPTRGGRGQKTALALVPSPSDRILESLEPRRGRAISLTHRNYDRPWESSPGPVIC